MSIQTTGKIAIVGLATSIGGGVAASDYFDLLARGDWKPCREVCADSPIERHHGGHLHIEPMSHSLSSTDALPAFTERDKTWFVNSAGWTPIRLDEI
jgi:hypothetical protein